MSSSTHAREETTASGGKKRKALRDLSNVAKVQRKSHTHVAAQSRSGAAAAAEAFAAKEAAAVIAATSAAADSNVPSASRATTRRSAAAAHAASVAPPPQPTSREEAPHIVTRSSATRIAPLLTSNGTPKRTRRANSAAAETRAADIANVNFDELPWQVQATLLRSIRESHRSFLRRDPYMTAAPYEPPYVPVMHAPPPPPPSSSPPSTSTSTATTPATVAATATSGADARTKSPATRSQSRHAAGGGGATAVTATHTSTSAAVSTATATSSAPVHAAKASTAAGQNGGNALASATATTSVAAGAKASSSSPSGAANTSSTTPTSTPLGDSGASTSASALATTWPGDGLRPHGGVCASWTWNRLCDARYHHFFNYLRRREQALLHRLVPRVHQAEITDDMWPVLIDWLVDVTEEFELRAETVHGAVNYLQQCLWQHMVRRSDFQMLGATCLFLSAKLHEKEQDLPKVNDLVYMGDNAYTQRRMLLAERMLVDVLQFDLHTGTPLAFLHMFNDTLHVSATRHATLFWLSHYLVELSLLHISMLDYLPSVLAGAAMLLALTIVHNSSEAAVERWRRTLGVLSDFDPHVDLARCVRDIHAHHIAYTANEALKAIKVKYNSRLYAQVSLLAPYAAADPFDEPPPPPKEHHLRSRTAPPEGK